jgi:hypothetical protein
MASNDIKFKVIATADGFDIVQKKQKGLADQIDKTNKSTKQLDKTQEKNYGRQKQGLIQTANGTKNFSKLSQTIGGGSSGLVGAYATLAANVFAATAAFNAFRQAAAFEQLVEGFTFMANESGRTTSIVVERLKEITGEALSTQEALQGASLALSAGFSSADLEGLAKVARGASLALGRNLNDAFDRLTRGAIKLEPEILDELGIMVRLDDAVDAYANSLGKGANQLTQFERQQAFLNAINEQGAKKYGDIADAIDVNPYDRLAAAFTDLTKAGLTSINTVLIPIAELFAGSSSVMVGGLVLFGSTLVTQMIPALGQMSQRAAESASEARMLSEALVESTDQSAIAAQAEFMSRKGGIKSQKDFRKALKDGMADDKAFGEQRRLTENRLAKLRRERSKAETIYSQKKTAENKKELASIQAKIDKEKEYLAFVNSPELRQNVGGQLAEAAGREDRQGRTSLGLSAINQAGPVAGFKEANNQLADFRKNADFTGVRTKVLGISIGGLGKTAKIASVGIKFFGSALLNMIPFIGQLIFALGLLSTAFNFLKNKINPPIKSLEDLKAITESMPEKFEQLAAATSKAGISAGEIGIKTYKVTAGILQELASAANLARKETEDLADSQIKKVNEARQRAGDLSGIAREALSPEEEADIRSKFERKATKQLQATLRQTFKDDSEESKLLREEIIKAANDLAKDGVGVTIDAAGKTTANATLITKILNIASKSVADINGELTSLQKQVSDNERVFGKFFQKFEKKTEFDDSLASFEALNNTITKLTGAGKGDEVAKILEDMGAQAEKFGLTSENAAEKLPSLIEGFAKLQENAINLQTELKRLDAGIKIAKQFEKLSVEGASRSLQLTKERQQAEIDANNLQIETLRNLQVPEEKRAGILAQIAGLEAQNVVLKNQQLNDSQTLLTLEETRIELALQDLKHKQQIAQLNRNIATSDMKYRAALSGAQASELSMTLSAIKNAKALAKEEQDLLDKQHEKFLNTQKQIKADALAALIQGESTQAASEAYDATIAAVDEIIRKEGELNDKRKENAQSKVESEITKGLVSNDLFTTIAAFSQIEDGTDKVAARTAVATTAFNQMAEAIGKLNEGFGQSIGFLTQMATQISNFSETVANITEVMGAEPIFDKIGLSNEQVAKAVAGAQIVGSALSAFGAAQQGFAQSRIKEIDNMIAAEKRMDGKSKESIAKIQQMEAKKLSIQKKAFEQDKKIKIATAIISTATAAAMAYSVAPGPIGIALAAAITALGLAQVALIKKTTFQGGGESASKPPSEINIGGQRSNRVDVSQQASVGETAYLRGGQGIGSNANDFIGGAMGRKGYADGGMLVGERGPEVVTKEEIIPNYELGGNKSMNLTFNVSALDGASVQEVLTNNQGAVVAAIRDAANSYGQDFLPDVNVGYGGDG